MDSFEHEDNWRSTREHIGVCTHTHTHTCMCIHTHVTLSLLPGRAEWFLLIPRDNSIFLQPRDGTTRIYITNLTGPLSSTCLPSIITFPQFTAFGSLISVFFVFSLLYRCTAFLLISCINPSSNHFFELLITEFSPGYGWVHVKNNKLHFCLVNLSFANLICRASTNRPKMGRGNTIFFPGGSDGKESACNVGEPGSIPGSGRSPGEENEYSLQYSCLGNLTEEPGGLQSIGLQRVRHNWATNTHTDCILLNNS